MSGERCAASPAIAPLLAHCARAPASIAPALPAAQVPLALAILSVSNPQLPIMDTLSKLSHDGDEQVSPPPLTRDIKWGANRLTARLHRVPARWPLFASFCLVFTHISVCACGQRTRALRSLRETK
jgi:hypothetical protein